MKQKSTVTEYIRGYQLVKIATFTLFCGVALHCAAGVQAQPAVDVSRPIDSNNGSFGTTVIPSNRDESELPPGSDVAENGCPDLCLSLAEFCKKGETCVVDEQCHAICQDPRGNSTRPRPKTADFSSVPGKKCPQSGNLCFHGTCADNKTCTCHRGYVGHQCSQQACDLPCKHGVCLRLRDNAPFCNCRWSWTGRLCDKLRDDLELKALSRAASFPRTTPFALLFSVASQYILFSTEVFVDFTRLLQLSLKV